MSDSKNVPVDRVRIFKRDGSCIAEFRASVARSLVIGGEGRAQFTVPTRNTQVCNEDVLLYGNWLLVQSSAGLGWCGVLDTPRDWSTRNVTVAAYTPERLFSQRIGPPEEVVTGSAGTIFESLIQRVNAAEQTVLRVGSIWRGGAQRQETLNPQPLSEYLRGLWERSGEDYIFTPSISADGKLTVLGHWTPSLGIETEAVLHEGKQGGNIEAVGRIMVEDGPIINSLFAYGDGETWNSRPNTTAEIPSSIGKFGLRQAAEEYSGVTSVDVLNNNAAQKVFTFRIPARTFALNVLNVGDTFKYIGLGNILRVQFQNAGFQGGNLGYKSRVRIVGLSYNPQQKNKIQLVAQEVT